MAKRDHMNLEVLDYFLLRGNYKDNMITHIEVSTLDAYLKIVIAKCYMVKESS